jgi:hypothetical protein
LQCRNAAHRDIDLPLDAAERVLCWNFHCDFKYWLWRARAIGTVLVERENLIADEPADFFRRD